MEFPQEDLQEDKYLGDEIFQMQKLFLDDHHCQRGDYLQISRIISKIIYAGSGTYWLLAHTDSSYNSC